MSEGDFAGACERFELLATLRHLQGSASKARLAAEPIPGSQRGIPAPVGPMRSGGLREHPPAIRELKRPAAIREFVEAGFFDGDVDWATLALDAVGDMVSDPFYEG